MGIRARSGPRAVPLALLAVVLASVSGCGLTGAGKASAESTPVGAAASPAAASPAAVSPAAVSPASALSPDSLAGLRDGGSTLRAATRDEATKAKISAAKATETAVRHLGLPAERSPDELVLAKITNDRFPHVVTPQDSPRPAAHPIIVDTLCWVGVFKAVAMPQPATLIVLVDAGSGKVLRTEMR